MRRPSLRSGLRPPGGGGFGGRLLILEQKEVKNQQQRRTDHHITVGKVEDGKIDELEIQKIHHFAPENPVDQVPKPAGNDQDAAGGEHFVMHPQPAGKQHRQDDQHHHRGQADKNPAVAGEQAESHPRIGGKVELEHARNNRKRLLLKKGQRQQLGKLIQHDQRCSQKQDRRLIHTVSPFPP